MPTPFEEREETIRRYFDAWLTQDPSALPALFARDVSYSECYGPEYHGLAQVQRWFREWNAQGRVLSWPIHRFYHAQNTAIVEWTFSCASGGKTSKFDGVSLVDFNTQNQIASVKEFKSQSEHYFPFGA